MESDSPNTNPASPPPARISTIRPGLLVALTSSVTGGIAYSRRDLPTGDAAPNAPTTADVSRWETVRVIEDAAEHARAVKCRSQARNAIVSACRHTSFGLLCPEEQEAQLWAACKEARELVDEFNATARTTRVDLFVLPGRVARDDQAAAQALLGEAASLVAAMERGIGRANADDIREAASKARALSAMLDGDAKEALDATIEAARKCARDLVRRVEKKGEEAAAVLASLDTGPIVAGRMALVALCAGDMLAPAGESGAGESSPAPAPEAPAPEPSIALPQVDLGDMAGVFNEPIPDEPAPIPAAPPTAARGFDWNMPALDEPAPAPAPKAPAPEAPAPAPTPKPAAPSLEEEVAAATATVVGTLLDLGFKPPAWVQNLPTPPVPPPPPPPPAPPPHPPPPPPPPPRPPNPPPLSRPPCPKPRSPRPPRPSP